MFEKRGRYRVSVCVCEREREKERERKRERERFHLKILRDVISFLLQEVAHGGEVEVPHFAEHLIGRVEADGEGASRRGARLGGLL